MKVVTVLSVLLMTLMLVNSIINFSFNDSVKRDFQDDKYNQTFINKNQSKILLLTPEPELGKTVGEILSKTSGTSYWDNPFQV